MCGGFYLDLRINLLILIFDFAPANFQADFTRLVIVVGGRRIRLSRRTRLGSGSDRRRRAEEVGIELTPADAAAIKAAPLVDQNAAQLQIENGFSAAVEQPAPGTTFPQQTGAFLSDTVGPALQAARFLAGSNVLELTFNDALKAPSVTELTLENSASAPSVTMPLSDSSAAGSQLVNGVLSITLSAADAGRLASLDALFKSPETSFVSFSSGLVTDVADNAARAEAGRAVQFVASSKKDGLSDGEIAAVVVCSTVAAAFLVLLVVVARHRRSQQKRRDSARKTKDLEYDPIAELPGGYAAPPATVLTLADADPEELIATRSFHAMHGDELQFSKGDRIWKLKDASARGWFHGRDANQREGLVHESFFQKEQPAAAPVMTAVPRDSPPTYDKHASHPRALDDTQPPPVYDPRRFRISRNELFNLRESKVDEVNVDVALYDLAFGPDGTPGLVLIRDADDDQNSLEIVID